MNEPIFTTSIIGFRVSVYQDRIVYRPMFGLGGEKSIPLSSIASVELAMAGVQEVVIETTGGERIKIPVILGKKEKLRDAIYQAKEMLRK